MQLFGSKFVKNAYSCFVAKNQKEKKVIFCISLERLNKTVFGKEIAVGRKLT